MTLSKKTYSPKKMEASSVISFSPPKTKLHNLSNSYSSSPSPPLKHSLFVKFPSKPFKSLLTSSPSTRNHLSFPPPLAIAEALDEPVADNSVSPPRPPQRIDKNGRFCSPRAARELALLIAYASCLEGSDPVRLFDKRVSAKKDPGYVFDKELLSRYDHMSFGGAPVEVGTEEEAEELILKNEKDSSNEAEVLSAPPKLVYNRFVLSLAREILVAVVDRWNQHVLVIDKIIPPNWKDEPAARILELCILHLAMSEIASRGTRHQIVINEAVDLAKRFCDGCAPRIINGCLRTFIKDYNAMNTV